MNRIENYKKLSEDIVDWIKDYATINKIDSLVVGVSGGVDSAVVSTLCAMTGLPTYCCVINIISNENHLQLAKNHIKSIRNRGVVSYLYSNLTSTYSSFLMEGTISNSSHIRANLKSRLRMAMLYSTASLEKGIVVGTGNKVEDFGIGFFTKYGDGGVDMSPIADLYKTEVRELGRYLGISQEILNTPPTDGLWEDGRTDEQQIGATYEELEAVMEWKEGRNPITATDRQLEIVDIYHNLHNKNQHKMLPIPIYKLPL